MPFYTKADVRIHYEEAGAGFPLGQTSWISISCWPARLVEVLTPKHFLVEVNANHGDPRRLPRLQVPQA